MVLSTDGIDIKITKKHIKNMYLRVSAKDASVHLSAPFAISNKKIIAFAKSKIDWLNKQIEKHKKSIDLPQRTYTSGEKVYVLGKLYDLVVLDNEQNNSITQNGDIVVLQCKKNSTTLQKAKIFDNWYRQLLQKVVDEILQKWALHGLVCKNWQIRDMSTRWGSYSTKTDKICINLQLAKYPHQCIDYLVLHELVHTKVPNHGKDFVAKMDKYMPNWREIKKQLNSQKILYKN